MRFEDRRALVTGAAGGIGAATARRLAAEGAQVAVTDLELDGVESVAAEISGFACVIDVTDDESVAAGVSASESEIGPIDILINNAGYGADFFFTRTDAAVWDRQIAVNLRGTLAVTHAVLGGMQERGFGVIVNVASEAGRMGSPGTPVYSAAKAGVIGFTKAIARESARYGVRCNAVAPGPIETAMLLGAEALGDVGRRMIEGMVSRTAMKRMGQPEEVAAVIAFLASDDASFVTGEALGVSGGMGTI